MATKEAEKAQAEAELRKMREKQDAKRKLDVNGSGDGKYRDDTELVLPFVLHSLVPFKHSYAKIET